MFLRNETVKVTSLAVGSLIVQFEVTRNTSETNVPDAYLINLIQVSDFPAVTALYQNITNTTQSIKLKRLRVLEPSAVVELFPLPPVRDLCDANCIIGVVLGVCFTVIVSIVVLMLVLTYRKWRGDLKGVKEPHEPFGHENPDVTGERVVAVPEEVVQLEFGGLPPTDVNHQWRSRRRRRLPPHRVIVAFSDEEENDTNTFGVPFSDFVFPTDKARGAAECSDGTENSDYQRHFGLDVKSVSSGAEEGDGESQEPPLAGGGEGRFVRPNHDPHSVVVFFDEEVFDEGRLAGPARRSTSRRRSSIAPSVIGRRSEEREASFLRRRSTSRRHWSVLCREEKEMPGDDEAARRDSYQRDDEDVTKQRHGDGEEWRSDAEPTHLDDTDATTLDDEDVVVDIDRNPLQTDSGVHTTAAGHQPFFTREHFASDPYYLELGGDAALDDAAATVDQLAGRYGPAHAAHPDLLKPNDRPTV